MPRPIFAALVLALTTACRTTEHAVPAETAREAEPVPAPLDHMSVVAPRATDSAACPIEQLAAAKALARREKWAEAIVTLDAAQRRTPRCAETYFLRAGVRAEQLSPLWKEYRGATGKGDRFAQPRPSWADENPAGWLMWTNQPPVGVRRVPEAQRRSEAHGLRMLIWDLAWYNRLATGAPVSERQAVTELQLRAGQAMLGLAEEFDREEEEVREAREERDRVLEEARQQREAEEAREESEE